MNRHLDTSLQIYTKKYWEILKFPFTWEFANLLMTFSCLSGQFSFQHFCSFVFSGGGSAFSLDDNFSLTSVSLTSCYFTMWMLFVMIYFKSNVRMSVQQRPLTYFYILVHVVTCFGCCQVLIWIDVFWLNIKLSRM